MKSSLQILISIAIAFLVFLFYQSSFAQWSTDPNINNAICTATGDQTSPTIVSDGSGGAIIAWYDSRNGNNDIYIQYINAAGTIQWTTDGVALYTSTGNQKFQIVSDGSGGVIITWQDTHSYSYGDIYAQHINASGTIEWTTNGVAIGTSAGNKQFQAVSDGTGGAIITWTDYDIIYAQRINASGTVQWATGGVACTATGGRQLPAIVSDGAGGAIITWMDWGLNGVYADIYAQRINAAGEVQWTSNGVALCTAHNSQWSPTIVSDGSGGAIIAWIDYRNDDNYVARDGEIYAQRISASSTVQWTQDGVAISATKDPSYPNYQAIVSDGVGGSIIVWQDSRSGSNNIYAQRISAGGTVQWTKNGVAVCIATGNQYSPTVVSDGTGGAIITWGDYRNGTNWDIYAQRINADRTVQWTPKGVAICTATGDQSGPNIASDGAGGAIITWQDQRNGNGDIYASKIFLDGLLPVELTSFTATANVTSGVFI